MRPPRDTHLSARERHAHAASVCGLRIHRRIPRAVGVRPIVRGDPPSLGPSVAQRGGEAGSTAPPPWGSGTFPLNAKRSSRLWSGEGLVRGARRGRGPERVAPTIPLLGSSRRESRSRRSRDSRTHQVRSDCCDAGLERSRGLLDRLDRLSRRDDPQERDGRGDPFRPSPAPSAAERVLPTPQARGSVWRSGGRCQSPTAAELCYQLRHRVERPKAQVTADLLVRWGEPPPLENPAMNS